MTTKPAPPPPPPPPGNLCEIAADFWRTVTADYILEPWQLFVLRAAADALHRSVLAEQVLDAEGATYVTGAGMIRQRPEVTVLRDSRIAFLRACRDLNLEVAS